MALFTMIALVFSAFHVYKSNQTARRLANNDLPIISALVELRASLLTQESYAAKYAILHDPAFIELFRRREADSLATLALLERSGTPREFVTLRKLYQEYHAASQRLFTGTSRESGALRASVLRLVGEVDASYDRRKNLLQAVLARNKEQQNATIWWSVAISLMGFLLAIGVAPFVTYHTFGTIRKLQSATHRIAAGDFDYDPEIPIGDEISELARDFSRMAARLKVLEQMSLDASPLTRLPGNIAIERVLEQRLEDGRPFAFCHADLDNFKPFGDHYGYAKGSDLLRVTGDIIQKTVTDLGGPEGFVGHVGGDDFVMVIPTDRFAAVCQAVIDRFDAEVVNHYSEQDLDAGGIAGCDRYGVHRFFPLTTISIAVIICGNGEFSSAVEIARVAARVKDRAKEVPGSNYLIGNPRRIE